MLAEGAFREDLYYRIMVIPIHLPPLRERNEDIHILFAHFLRLESAKLNRNPPAVDRDVLACLNQYSWPGNVRELENLARRLTALVWGPKINLADLPPILVQESLNSAPLPSSIPSFTNTTPSTPILTTATPSSATLTTPKTPDKSAGGLPPLPHLPEERFELEAYIDALVCKALYRFKGNQSKTAKYLGISRHSLMYRLEKRGIQYHES